MIALDKVTRTVASRAEKRRVLKEERKHRERGEPGLGLPAVEIRPDEIMRMAKALEPSDRMVLFALLDGRHEPYLTLEEYVERAHPGYLWGAHLRALARRLQDVADGLIRRLMIFMPPRHGKSELVARLFTAYYLYRHSSRDVAITTYGAELSYDLSRDARTNFVQMGGALSLDSAAIKSWHTAERGNCWATGVGGPATGRGYHLGVIDDPYKDHEEAASVKVRRTRWNWYKSTFRTRAAPGAAIVILMTRWHMDDLAASLLREEAVTRQGWHVIEMPAERRAPEQRIEDSNTIGGGRVDFMTGMMGTRYQWPATITLEADARDHERWLWTQRFPIEEYESLKREQGGDSGYFWNALYQQRPIATEGGLFKREHFKPIAREKLPRFVQDARWWDLAATANDGAMTAGLRGGKDKQGNVYITGLVLGQWDPGPRNNIIRQTAELEHAERVTYLFPQDPGAAGKEVAQGFVRLLQGIVPVVIRIETGSKDLRATLPASDVANGLVYVVAEPWAAVFIQHCVDFGPGAEFRDVVDAFSGLHAYLVGKREHRPVQGTVSTTTLGQ